MRRSDLATAVMAIVAASALSGNALSAEPAAKNLNSVPEDGLDTASVAGPDSKFIRQTLSARPNEDLVICVAGCFSGRDRVVYAQPIEKTRPATVRVKEPDTTPPPSAEPAKPDKALGPSASNDAPVATISKRSPSFDPRSPAILNGAPK